MLMYDVCGKKILCFDIEWYLKNYIIYVKLNLMNNFKVLMILSKIKYILNFFKI